MSKKRTGLLIVLGAALGAAAAGISYYLKYKSFNDELDKDFHDYEENADGTEHDSPVPCQDAVNRTYITLDPAKSHTADGEPVPAQTSDVQTAAQETQTQTPGATVEEDVEDANA
ncbi:MAG: hypothetical protein HFE84_09680 [Lachnospiraceae bacterium]|jgi:hypothetical protein|nr:hypothetical protein [Lachnospiraceae bacterium]